MPRTGEAINQISKIVEEYYPERFAADPPPPTKREMRPQKSPLAWMETVGGLVALFPIELLTVRNSDADVDVRGCPEG